MTQAENKSNQYPTRGNEIKSSNIHHCEICDSLPGVAPNFCSSCGSRLTNQSRNQSQGIQESLKRLLPAQYIEKLIAANGSLKGERRVVTILFADVKGSTSISENLDPEDVLEMMNGAFEVMIQPILKYEGTLARLMGDAIMAMFGAPIAHEDDPERACRAAIDIINGARKYADSLLREHGITGFNMRVGINTGLVVVGEVGAANRVEYTAMGDAVNVAARMESAAEPGNILITDTTYKLISNRFLTESVGPINLKGKSEPVSVYKLLRLRESILQGTGKYPMKTAIIGREIQLDKLKNAFDSVHRGCGNIIAIVGDAGIGKSRLIHEAHIRWFQDGIWGECSAFAYTREKSYEAIRTLIYSILGLQKETDGETVKNAIHSMVDDLDQKQIPKIFPYLSLILDRGPDREVKTDAESLDPQVIQKRIMSAIGVFIRMIAKKQPLVLFAEDMHWFDHASLKLFESLFQLTKEIPLLIIMASRSLGEEIANFHKRNAKLHEESYHIVTVPPLTEKESNIFLDSFSGITISTPLRNEILSKTQGNPFFIEEVVHQIQEHGETTIAIPDTLRGIIMARLDSLPLREKQSLQASSVFGHSFQRRLLIHTMKDMFTPVVVDLSLTELTKRGFITRINQKSSVFAPNEEEWYIFSHHLTQQVIHDNILLSQRKVFHKLAGEAMESVYQDCLDEYASELAAHFEIAGEKKKAIYYLVVAGGRASSLYANAEAIRCYNRALSVAHEGNIKRDDMQKIHEGLGDAYCISAEYSIALKHYQMALDHTDGFLQTAVLHRKRGMVMEKSGSYDSALSSFDEAIKNLKSEINLIESARIYNGLARVYYRQRQYNASIDVGMLALDLMTQLNNNWGKAEAYGTLGIAYCAAGDMPKGIGSILRALEIWEQEDEVYGLAATLNNLGWAYQRNGDISLAEERYRESIALCESNYFRHGLASACDNLSQLLIHKGNHEEANYFLKKAVTILSEIESQDSEPIPELWQQSATW